MPIHDKYHLRGRKKMLYRTKMQENNTNKYSRKDEQMSRWIYEAEIWIGKLAKVIREGGDRNMNK